MDINRGFKIDNPNAFVVWYTTERELASTLGSQLRRITNGYYTLTCESLGGLKHELGFHFEPRNHGRLRELEFFRRAYPDQSASFAEFEEHFEREFGPPCRTTPGSEGFPSYEWTFKNVTIRHYVFDRFGPEEHLEIHKGAPNIITRLRLFLGIR
jgi:hypothetical protein